MSKTLLVLMSAASLITLFAIPSRAEEYPLLDLRHRTAVGVTLRYHGLAGATNVPTPNEYLMGPIMQYRVVPHLMLVAGSLYGSKTKLWDTYVGVTIPLWDGGGK